jgi:hypothetical protein
MNLSQPGDFILTMTYIFVSFRPHAIRSLDLGWGFGTQSLTSLRIDRIEFHGNDHPLVRGHDDALEHHGPASELGQYSARSH